MYHLYSLHQCVAEVLFDAYNDNNNNNNNNNNKWFIYQAWQSETEI